MKQGLLPIRRKPKLWFDVAASPSHVTFDDGARMRRNLPWCHYFEGRWANHNEPHLIRLTFPEWRIVLTGLALGPLFGAVEERTLLRVAAQPGYECAPARDADTVVTAISFIKPMALDLTPRRGGKKEQIDLNLAG